MDTSASTEAGSVSPRFFTTLHLPQRAAWKRRAEMVDPSSLSHLGLLNRVMRAARSHELLVLNGARPTDQVAAALIGLTRPERQLILADCTWELGSSPIDRAVTRIGCRAIARAAATYCVLSSQEQEAFPRTWNVDPASVAYTPWCYTLSDEELNVPVSDQGFAFAGGDSVRDYLPLIEAARGLGAPVRIAARRAVDSARVDLPSNVRAAVSSHREFVELTARARVVVVPLQARGDRSAGQGTYLNAMALGKAVIVSDVMGARDYIEPGVTGLLVPPGDAEAMRAALEWTLANENDEAVRELGGRARKAARETFGPDDYVAALLRVADAAVRR